MSEACGSGNPERLETDVGGEACTVVRRASTLAFEGGALYVVAYVERAEGPLFCTEIVDLEIDGVENEMTAESQ